MMKRRRCSSTEVRATAAPAHEQDDHGGKAHDADRRPPTARLIDRGAMTGAALRRKIQARERVCWVCGGGLRPSAIRLYVSNVTVRVPSVIKPEPIRLFRAARHRSTISCQSRRREGHITPMGLVVFLCLSLPGRRRSGGGGGILLFHRRAPALLSGLRARGALRRSRRGRAVGELEPHLRKVVRGAPDEQGRRHCTKP